MSDEFNVRMDRAVDYPVPPDPSKQPREILNVRGADLFIKDTPDVSLEDWQTKLSTGERISVTNQVWLAPDGETAVLVTP